VKRYAEENNISYKNALSAASGPFKTHKKKQKYTEPKLRKSKKKEDKKEDGGCHIIKKISVKKRLRDTIKKECGICLKRKHKVPPKTQKTTLTSGSSKARTGKRAKRKQKQKQKE